MKQIIYSIIVVAIWCATMSSGCGDSGGSGGNGISTVPPGGTGGSGSGSTSTQASAARFTIYKNCLYTLHNGYLQTWDITDKSKITSKSAMFINNSIEALYIFRERLYVASMVGVTFYDLQNPYQPSYIGSVSHITGCDPVVANATNMFYTVRGGTSCRNNNINSLYSYSINANGTSLLLDELPLTKPMGLGINSNYLYVCDNGSGLKIVDISTPASLQVIKSITNPQAVDVIVSNNILIVQHKNGVYYYDITDAANPKEVSKILK